MNNEIADAIEVLVEFAQEHADTEDVSDAAETVEMSLATYRPK